MDLGIDGRVAVVTAASRGLGRATARALSEEGCRLVISARSREDLDALRDDLGTEAAVVAADMSDPATPARLVATALDRFGRCDIAVANNGGPPPGRALEIDDDAVTAAVEANLLASVRLVRAALAPMRDAGWGRLCCITSVSIKQPMPGLALSNVARTGLWAWAKTAATELGDGITLNLACPGAHATDRMVALGGAGGGGPLGDPDDFGRVVAFLCSEPARFVNGTAVVVDGGRVQGLL